MSSYFDVCSLNCHLFGDTARPGGIRLLRLYHNDADRAKTIGTNLGYLKPDIFGGQEIWSPKEAEILYSAANGLENHGKIFDVFRAGPFQRGFDEVLDRHAATNRAIRAFRNLRELSKTYPVMTGIAEQAFDVLTGIAAFGDRQTRAGLGLLEPIESRLRTWLDGFVRNQLILGAGVVLFSRYPVSPCPTLNQVIDGPMPDFFPFEEKYGIEQGAQKGVLYGRVHFPWGQSVTVMVTHLQEGVTPKTKRVRRNQIIELAQLIETTPGPHIVMLDANINGEMMKEGKWQAIREYTEMLEILGLKDAFPPGAWTYDAANQFAKRVGRHRQTPRHQRIDYILVSKSIQVIEEETKVVQIFEHQTDHRGLIARLYIE